MLGVKERERRVYRKGGSLFEVVKVTRDVVILRAVDGSSQILTGKKSFKFLFEDAPGRDC